jgi:hypothetical protein
LIDIGFIQNSKTAVAAGHGPNDVYWAEQPAELRQSRSAHRHVP